MWGKTLAAAIIVIVVVWIVVYVRTALGGWMGSHLGWDFDHYIAGARAWLAEGSPYDPAFVAGPFTFDDMAFMHPPIALPLFAAFTVLPAILWWAIPLGITAWHVWRSRPSPLGWAVIAIICGLPLTLEHILLGNSAMWLMAFAALGLRYGWPWALLVIKPTLAFVGLLDIRRRETWIGAVVVGLACLPFGGLWLEWLAVVRNFDGAPLYTIVADLPMVLLPLARHVVLDGDPGRTVRPVAAGHARPVARASGAARPAAHVDGA